jgi:hypothetical protein
MQHCPGTEPDGCEDNLSDQRENSAERARRERQSGKMGANGSGRRPGRPSLKNGSKTKGQKRGAAGKRPKGRKEKQRPLSGTTRQQDKIKRQQKE